MRAKDVGRDDTREVAAILLIVQTVLHVHHALCVGIALWYAVTARHKLSTSL